MEIFTLSIFIQIKAKLRVKSSARPDAVLTPQHGSKTLPEEESDLFGDCVIQATTPYRIVLFLLDSWQHHCCQIS